MKPNTPSSCLFCLSSICFCGAGAVSTKKVQPRPIKSSINDGSFDGNYWGGREYLSAIQWLTVLFDPTHSHHLINGLQLSFVFVVCQCDQNVTCDRADSPLIPNYASPNEHSAQSF